MTTRVNIKAPDDIKHQLVATIQNCSQADPTTWRDTIDYKIKPGEFLELYVYGTQRIVITEGDEI